MIKQIKLSDPLILGWAEVLACSWLLLRLTPSLLGKYQDHSFSSVRLEDWSLIISINFALCFLMAGVAVVVQHRFWKMFHYLMTALVLLLSLGLLKITLVMKYPLEMKFFVQVGAALVLSLATMMVKKTG